MKHAVKENEMSNMHKQTWDTYASAWAVTSPEEKRALYAKCLAAECEYNDPQTKAIGHDELLDTMLAFHKMIPGGHFETKYFRAHNNQSIARWDMFNAEGAIIGDGISYARYNADGKLLAMTGFFDA